MRKSYALAAASFAILSTQLISHTDVHAAAIKMRTTHVQLNGKQLSSPDGFTLHKTTYMPLFYVQQLLKALQIANRWTGSTWEISANYVKQPLNVLKAKSGTVDILLNGHTFAEHVDKTVAVDPAAHQKTTYIPIWYIQQTLKQLGLTSTWNGTTWNVEAPYTDVSKTADVIAPFSTLADAKKALLQYPGGQVQNASGAVVFTEPSFKTVDLRAPAPANVNDASLNKYLQAHDSIMTGLGQVFIDAQSTYGVDANYLVSHALEETGSGGNVSEIALTKNNLYGYGANDANPLADAGSFPSEAYAIRFQAWEVRNNYLTPGADNYVSPTLDGMSRNYAKDPNWANHVNDLMNQLAIDLHDNITSYQQYVPGNNLVPPPNSTTEPVYQMNGALGVVHSDTYYGSNIPVYANAASGAEYMFVRTIGMNDNGPDVKTVQQALNDKVSANLTVDGKFGPNTATALKNFQANHGLGPTGTCDFTTWNDLLSSPSNSGTVAAGQQLHIDQIAQGLAGSSVTEWFHIVGRGWVNASDVTFSNVYRLTVADPNQAANATIAVMDSHGANQGTLHVGDYVVAASAQPQGGQLAISYVNQSTNQLATGYVSAADASLTPVLD